MGRDWPPFCDTPSTLAPLLRSRASRQSTSALRSILARRRRTAEARLLRTPLPRCNTRRTLGAFRLRMTPWIVAPRRIGAGAPALPPCLASLHCLPPGEWWSFRAVVIPSGASKARSRGIVAFRVERLAPLPGGQGFLDSLSLARNDDRSRGMTTTNLTSPGPVETAGHA